MQNILKDTLKKYPKEAKYLMLTNVQTKKVGEPNYFTIFVTKNKRMVYEMHEILMELVGKYNIDYQDSGVTVISTEDKDKMTLTLFDYTNGVIE